MNLDPLDPLPAFGTIHLHITSSRCGFVLRDQRLHDIQNSLLLRSRQIGDGFQLFFQLRFRPALPGRGLTHTQDFFYRNIQRPGHLRHEPRRDVARLAFVERECALKIAAKIVKD